MKWFTHPPEVYWRAYYRKRHRHLRRIPENEQVCLNCGTKYHGNYCPVCGQSHLAKSLTLLHILRNFWISLTTLRRGYAITLLELTGHPGFFMRHYIKGHRNPYVHPFRLLTVLLTIYVLFSATFQPDVLPKDVSFGFIPFLKTVQTGDWRQTMAQYTIAALQYIHDTPLLQMAATRFRNWMFQNPALQALTLFPFFTILSYTLFHADATAKEDEGTGDGESRSPGIFETTFKEPLIPLWDALKVVCKKAGKWLGQKGGVAADWWVKKYGRPVLILKIYGLIKVLVIKTAGLCRQGIRKLKSSPARVEPFSYSFIEIIYMRGYFTCLLMEVNIVLFLCGLSVTPFNPWIIAGTVWIYKHFFRCRWWITLKRTCWMYILTILLAIVYCMVTTIIEVVRG